MNLEKQIIDTIKEWQIKIGYREGDMKLYYPGKSLALLLGLEEEEAEKKLPEVLEEFCREVEPRLGRIEITGNHERYCVDVPAKGCAYIAGKIPEPEFLKIFLREITKPGNTIEQIRVCFAAYAAEHNTVYREETLAEESADEGTLEERHAHMGHVFYFQDETVEEYVYCVEENEFGLTYHRFTRSDFENIK